MKKKSILKKVARSDKDLIGRVQGIVAHQLKKKPNMITLDVELQKDLGADSLDALEIIMTIEEEFNLQIPEEIARKARTVQDIINYVKQSRSK